MSESVIVICPLCSAKLKVKPEKVGATANCPGCKQSIIIAVEQKVETQKLKGTSHLPATQKQKDFAESLGCVFHPSITRGEISELIEIGKDDQQSRRWADLAAMQNREQAQVQTIRKELLEDMADDPPVSAATPRQMVDSLDDRETCAVLITLPFDQIESYSQLQGVDVAIAGSNSMTNEDTSQLLMAVSIDLQKHLGTSFESSNSLKEMTAEEVLQLGLTDWRDNDGHGAKSECLHFRFASTILLAFNTLSCEQTKIGELLGIPAKAVEADFLAYVGVATTSRTDQPRRRIDLLMNPGVVEWEVQRIVVRKFVGGDWMCWYLFD